MALTTEAPPKLRAASPEAQATLEPVVQKALAKKPEDRYATAAALLADFHAAMNSNVAPLEQEVAPKIRPIYIRPGKILHEKLKIVQVLGEGRWKSTYKAEQMGTNPPHYYTVKELPTGPTSSEEKYETVIERFEKDVDLLRGLNHPHIVPTVLTFQEYGKRFLVTEFVPGRDMGRVLDENNGPLPEEKVAKWMIQICEALSYIHSYVLPIKTKGHLGPGDIMITPDDEARLLIDDICLEWYVLYYRYHWELERKRLGKKLFLTSISFESPEYLGARRYQETDTRSDIYSLGAIMYYLLTNDEPDALQTPLPESMLAKNSLLRTAQFDGKTVCLIEQVVIKAMQQNLLDRFQDVQAMRTALLDVLSYEGAERKLKHNDVRATDFP